MRKRLIPDPPRSPRVTVKAGHCKSWTLDSGLDCGLDFGPKFGLKNITLAVSSTINALPINGIAMSSSNLVEEEASSIVSTSDDTGGSIDKILTPTILLGLCSSL